MSEREREERIKYERQHDAYLEQESIRAKEASDHTTHFDDCGCKSKRLEAERDALRLRVAECEAALRSCRQAPHEHRGLGAHGDCAVCIARAALSGDTTALRAMLVDMGMAVAEYAKVHPIHRADCETLATRFLGASKEGGE